MFVYSINNLKVKLLYRSSINNCMIGKMYEYKRVYTKTLKRYILK